ncbi:MAG: long-chain acyl-[acyl-carrier-protein] reductase [Oscillatoriales cyanobacterium SM2_2_1]|nr:long-chain acyl-[acyl-carrier-protein] reductase [Oscillatoriales cyanobacterium SM2_2_1]
MFGLIGHLTSLQHAQSVAHRLGLEEYAAQGLDFWCSAPPQVVDQFTATSVTGQSISGIYIESCFLPEMLANRHFKTATRKVLNAMALAQKQQAMITALGGFSSIIFENFNLSQLLQVRDVSLNIERFTTGNTHTAYIICQQIIAAAQRHNLNLSHSTVAVCGATGDIGSAVCRWISYHLPQAKLLLVARNHDRLQELQAQLGHGKITALNEALAIADIVVWVTSMTQGIELHSDTLKKPSLLIDGGYPKNLSTLVQHPDVYVFKGGIVEHSLDIPWQIMELVEFAKPSRQMFACFAEAMLLEFEGWHTNFSWGRNQITLEKMERIGVASQKHGFRPLI